MPALIDLTKKQFGRLTVLERAKNVKPGKTKWKCRCSCGNIATISASHLKSGHTISCGCFKKEVLSKRNFTHGLCDSPEYRAWNGITARCYNPSEPVFKHYGGRGIKVCGEWRHNFMAFYNHVGKRPSPKHSIDRIDNNSDYRPGNVRWATYHEQMNNKRTNHLITIHEWTMTLSQWAQFVGLKYDTLHCRIVKNNWPLTKAVFTPVRHR